MKSKYITKVFRPPSMKELSKEWNVPLIEADKPGMIYFHGYYDGPLSGFCSYQNKVHYFDTREDDYGRRIFNVFCLSEDQIEKGLFNTQKLFETNPEYCWAASSEGKEKFIFAEPWTEERCRVAGLLPEVDWENLTKATKPDYIFREGDDLTSEMYDWADFVIQLSEGKVKRAFSHHDEIILIFQNNVDRGVEFEIKNDGKFLIIFEEYGKIKEEGPIEEYWEEIGVESLAIGVEKAISFLDLNNKNF